MTRERYEVTDREWSTIEPSLLNKPPPVPRVYDRRVLNGGFLQGLSFNRSLGHGSKVV
jgi:transposase